MTLVRPIRSSRSREAQGTVSSLGATTVIADLALLSEQASLCFDVANDASSTCRPYLDDGLL